MNDAPTTGHNSDQDEAARKANFFLHLNTIETIKGKLDEVRGQYNECRKLAKADGIKLSDMDFALRALTIEDDTIVAEDLRRQMEIARWLKLPVGYQVNFAEADRRDGAEKAFAAGEFAGMRRQDRNDHGYKGDLEQEWLKGYDAGADRLKAVSEAEGAEGAKILSGVKFGKGQTDDDPFEDPNEAA